MTTMTNMMMRMTMIMLMIKILPHHHPYIVSGVREGVSGGLEGGLLIQYYHSANSDHKKNTSTTFKGTSLKKALWYFPPTTCWVKNSSWITHFHFVCNTGTLHATLWYICKAKTPSSKVLYSFLPIKKWGASVGALYKCIYTYTYMHSVTAQDSEIDPPDQGYLGMFRF